MGRDVRTSRLWRQSGRNILQLTTLTSFFLVFLTLDPYIYDVQCSFLNEGQSVIESFSARYNVTSQVDLVFVLDRSSSISTGWDPIMNFVKNILDRFTIDADHARIAIVTFSSDATEELNYLLPGPSTDGATKCSVYRQLAGLHVQFSGHTATYAALDKARQILLNSREGAKKAVILVTDGDSNVGDHPRKMSIQIQSLSWDLKWNSSLYGPQVEIYAFGISGANVDFLRSVASDRPSHTAYFPDFHAFDQFTRRIRKDIVEDTWITTNSSNCGSRCGSTNSECKCGSKTGRFSCACAPGYEMDNTGCTACKRGFYKESFLPEPCKPCSLNSTTSVTGSANSSSCHPLPGHRRCPDLHDIPNGIKFFVSGNHSLEVANTNVSCKDVRDGNSCHFECDRGYRMINGSKVMACNVWGEWEGTVPQCKVVECDPISEVWANNSQVTLTYANSSRTTYGSVIFASCWSGLVPFGPTTWTCGENTRWRGVDNFQCKEVNCSHLAPVPFSDVVPSDCASSKKPLGYECQLICRDGFQLTGAGNFTCSFEGKTFWKPRPGEEGKTKCNDIRPPEITCAADKTVVSDTWDKNCSVIDYENPPPSTKDNAGVPRYAISGQPANDLFCTGVTELLTYTAFDKTNNSEHCTRRVSFVEKTAEVVSCPDDIVLPVNSTSKYHYVTWPDPVFKARNGDILDFVCNPNTSTEFSPGNRSVVCHPTNSRNQCNFWVNITEPHCEKPFADRVPYKADVDCKRDSSTSPLRCTFSCRDGYERIVDGPKSYDCRWDGSWALNGSWPLCYRTQRPNEAQISHNFIVMINSSLCAAKRDTIMDTAISTVNGILKENGGPCRSPIICRVVSVDINCRETIFGNDSVTNVNSAQHLIENPSSSFMGNFSLEVVIVGLRPVLAGQQLLTTSQQRTIYKVLAGVSAEFSYRTEQGELRWNADGADVVVVAVVEGPFKFIGFNCSADDIGRSTIDTAECFSCPPGTFYQNGSHESSGSCVPCPIGYYKDRDGGGTCRKCDGVRSTTSEGAMDASQCRNPCVAGYSSSTGYEPCLPCRIGTYQSDTASTACLPCPGNQTTSFNESTSADDCYEVVLCDDVHKPCELHGSCIVKHGQVNCLCNAGFKGLDCQVNINECEHSLCENNGTCVDGIAGYTCECPPSFTGERCGEEVDECATSPCSNGSSCIDGFISYSCVCAPGFSGPNCEVDVDDCHDSHCLFGTCQDGINSFTCSCFEGYTGMLCDKQIDYCVGFECLNEGRCVSKPSGAICGCSAGFTGQHCETKIDACSSKPCLNNATCTSQTGAFACWCQPGYIGNTCDKEVSPDFDLVFPKPSTSNYVMMKMRPVAVGLRQVSICTWMRSSDFRSYGTIWSYSAESNWLTADFANVLTASDYGNLKFLVKGETATTGIALNNGMWHHLCFLWSGEMGNWSLYINGTLRQQGNGLAKGAYLETDGILVLGQRQRNLGEDFSQQESFVGELTQFAIFDNTLSAEVVADLASNGSDGCKRSLLGNVVAWTDVLSNVQGNVSVRRTSWCKDVNECQFDNLNNCSSGTRCEDSRGSFACVPCDTPGCRSPALQGCANNPCQNDGTCEEDANRGYYCNCRPDYTGRHCDQEIFRVSCDANPCQNGGTCNSTQGKCMCANTWTGTYCQTRSIVRCAAQPCFNNGTCNELDNGYSCTCPSLNVKLGKDCEYISACASSPCGSEGMCVTADDGTGYACDCRPGYSGRNCEVAVHCQTVTCENGGTCISLEKGFKCNCKVKYRGDYCKVAREEGFAEYDVVTKLRQTYSSQLPHNQTFRDSFINQIHIIYSPKEMGNGGLQVTIKDIREGSVLVDFHMNHTYFLDDFYAGFDKMKNILETELQKGRLGTFEATPDGFVFNKAEKPSSSNAAIYASVIIIIIILALVIAVVATLYIRNYRTTRNLNKSSAPLRVSNPMYHGDFTTPAENRCSVQESVYCDPDQLLRPYATSEDSDKDSDPGTNGNVKQKKKKNNWHLRQSIPLPPKPDEGCSLSLAEMSRATPPPPYSAHGQGPDHPPVPPSRDPPNKFTHSALHNYENEAAASSCYFMPLSDEEAASISRGKDTKRVSSNPPDESEDAYLIPCQPDKDADNSESIEMTYLMPTLLTADEEAACRGAVSGGAVGGGANATTELNCKESSVVYAIRSTSCEATKPSDDTAAKVEQPT